MSYPCFDFLHVSALLLSYQTLASAYQAPGAPFPTGHKSLLALFPHFLPDPPPCLSVTPAEHQTIQQGRGLEGREVISPHVSSYLPLGALQVSLL